MGTNWYQTSGEAKALYLQGYNVATQKLKEYLKLPHNKLYSIVLDLGTGTGIMPILLSGKINMKKATNIRRERRAATQTLLCCNLVCEYPTFRKRACAG